MHQKTNIEKIGHYEISHLINKGGMGEVFLAFDPICKRFVALKCIRQELKNHAIIKNRFLREAHVAAQLNHPAIIPIFSIESSCDPIFYTMPFVEGQTLKDILKITYEEQKEGEIKHPIGGSILALTRIFLSVCEAIAYTHSKGILHRDLKPDNIIVGKYGEVLILDWGLADFLGKNETSFEEENLDETGYKDLTRPGKVPGTLNYIAPERVLGHVSDVTVDIYSLGVILYQILTLCVPFRRSTVKSFRKTMHLEKLNDPLELAPHRDIPQHLADIAKRALRFSKDERFQSVDEIIEEIKAFLEGRPEWIPTCVLKIDRREDWEFQENILLTKHLAITRFADVMEWVSLMLSKASFTGNTKIETQIKLGSDAKGVGLLLAVPPSSERKGPNEGYCIFFSDHSYVYHNNVEVIDIQGGKILKEKWQSITIEKVDQNLKVFFNGQQICHYISHIPVLGTHIGIIYRDANFELKPLRVSVGSHNAMVNCLAVPDAFLSNKNYTKALLEYRRIANSFAGRAEGREAIFRAGVTLLQEALKQKNKKEKEERYLLALEEFGKLRFTPGAPLEYLGKSLVYKAMQEIEEEIKCLELSLRKYAKHPLLRQIKEQIIFRLHESASKDRKAAYHFALLSLRYLPEIFSSSDHKQLIESLKNHLEQIPFFLPSSCENQLLACQLSFWIPKPMTFIEVIETTSDGHILLNALYGLFAFGFKKWAEKHPHLFSREPLVPLLLEKKPKIALETFFNTYLSSLNESQLSCLYFLLDQLLLQNKAKDAHSFLLKEKIIPHTPQFDALRIEAALLSNHPEIAKQILDQYPEETLSDEYSPLYVPMGCYLRYVETEEIALSHFRGSIDLPHPPTSLLLSDFLKGKIKKKKGWILHAFVWEKIQLFRHLRLYYHSSCQFKQRNESNQSIKKEIRQCQKAAVLEP